MSIRLSAPPDSGQNNLWGIPWFGIAVRAILCVPQLILLWVLGVAVALATIVSWAPILINGRQSTILTGLFRTIAQLQSRVYLYVVLATGAYPGVPGAEGHPIQAEVDDDPGQNRLWGIPYVGIIVRAILIIPHAFVLWVLGIGGALLVLVSWIPVLVNGRQADSIVSYLTGVYRYGLRVGAYVILVTGTYPPFSLSD
jgi:hypothetical protein